MNTPHTSCNKGKRVRVVLKDGREFVSRFVERTSKFVVMECGRYTGEQIRSFTIVR